jgi:glycosyltransferase involved in cell wall biosynthesis
MTSFPELSQPLASGPKEFNSGTVERNPSLSQPKILFVCNISHPINSGAGQRVYHILRGVASVGEVTLIYPTKCGDTDPDLEALRPLCKRVYTFPEDSLTGRRDARLQRPLYWLIHKLRYLHPVLSAHMQNHWSAEGRALVRALCTEPFDLVWAERISSLRMLPPSLKTRTVVDLDDLEHRKLRSYLKLGKHQRMTPLYLLELLKLRRLESKLHALPYEFTVCSEIDRAALGRKGQVWLVPNGTTLPTNLPFCIRDKAEPILLFVGAMYYEPNEDAVTFFARAVLPLIRKEVADAKFLIVGMGPSSKVQALHDGKSIVVVGQVPDVGEYLCRAAVVVVPIRFGGGTRIKILEAMAYRRPVVATSIGAEGLEVDSEKHLLLADSPSAFASACVRVLKDNALSEELAEKGFQLVKDRYQWLKIERTIGKIVQRTTHEHTCEQDQEVLS